MVSFPSIYDHVPPLETGGIIARVGFLFQDHVAAGFCIDMLTACELTEVRCESQDDITLIWHVSGECTVEFVQVKASELNQLWTVAKVCEPGGSGNTSSPEDQGKSGASVFEKLFANDRFAEQAQFRVVTRWDVNSELKILKLPLTSPARQLDADARQNLCAKIKNKHPNFVSPKGNDSSYFVSKTYWGVAHSGEALEEKSCGSLRRYVESKGIYLVTAQIKRIYQKILQKVQTAACADWKVEPESKILRRSDFQSWVDAVIRAVKDAVVTNASETVRQKMEDAELASDYITSALSLLQSYREDSLSAKYFEPTDRTFVEQEIWAELNELRSRFDSGAFSDSSVEFHSRCISRMRELQTELPVSVKPSLSFLQGCMYYITGRCGHRFRRLSS